MARHHLLMGLALFLAVSTSAAPADLPSLANPTVSTEALNSIERRRDYPHDQKTLTKFFSSLGLLEQYSMMSKHDKKHVEHDFQECDENKHAKRIAKLILQLREQPLDPSKIDFLTVAVKQTLGCDGPDRKLQTRYAHDDKTLDNFFSSFGARPQYQELSQKEQDKLHHDFEECDEEPHAEHIAKALLRFLGKPNPTRPTVKKWTRMTKAKLNCGSTTRIVWGKSEHDAKKICKKEKARKVAKEVLENNGLDGDDEAAIDVVIDQGQAFFKCGDHH